MTVVDFYLLTETGSLLLQENGRAILLERSVHTATREGAETGAGVDAAALVASLSSAETGTGADDVTLMAFIVGADTWEGVDGASLLAELADGDSFSVVEVEVSAAYLTDSEEGSALEALVGLVASIVSSDSGSGAETSAADYPLEKTSTDVGVGVDDQVVVYLVHILTDSDSAQGFDLPKIMYVPRTTLLSAGLSGKPSQIRRLGGGR